jgi:hypothetical protein
VFFLSGTLYFFLFLPSAPCRIRSRTHILLEQPVRPAKTDLPAAMTLDGRVTLAHCLHGRGVGAWRGSDTTAPSDACAASERAVAASVRAPLGLSEPAMQAGSDVCASRPAASMRGGAAEVSSGVRIFFRVGNLTGPSKQDAPVFRVGMAKKLSEKCCCTFVCI